MRNRFTNFNYLSLERQTMKCAQQNTMHIIHNIVHLIRNINNIIFSVFVCIQQLQVIWKFEGRKIKKQNKQSELNLFAHKFLTCIGMTDRLIFTLVLNMKIIGGWPAGRLVGRL